MNAITFEDVAQWVFAKPGPFEEFKGRLELSDVFVEMKYSAGKMVVAFQERGLLPKGKPRGRKSSGSTSQ